MKGAACILCYTKGKKTARECIKGDGDVEEIDWVISFAAAFQVNKGDMN